MVKLPKPPPDVPKSPSVLICIVGCNAMSGWSFGETLIHAFSPSETHRRFRTPGLASAKWLSYFANVASDPDSVSDPADDNCPFEHPPLKRATSNSGLSQLLSLA